MSPLALWLCGHIHEGRGVTQHDFANSQQHQQRDDNDDSSSTPAATVIVNAANANAGRAQRLDYGPMVIDLRLVKKEDTAADDDSCDCHVEIVSLGQSLHAEAGAGCTTSPTNGASTIVHSYYSGDDTTYHQEQHQPQEQQQVLDFFRNAYFGSTHKQ
eukprot:CAMPEP_0168743406 /NCGR_PEP_ID=MMETSP0724-20121128/13560_1 /TAXON_ID=265536 /ORGANISM="Amphiprora sp., Strain CCMP467" /LENGTH=157 /DNA_ID=CAMNT_0008791035 /DNA_START=69 /DNA_END=542 /DNA_ORIENTATION=-